MNLHEVPDDGSPLRAGEVAQLAFLPGRRAVELVHVPDQVGPVRRRVGALLVAASVIPHLRGSINKRCGYYLLECLIHVSCSVRHLPSL